MEQTSPGRSDLTIGSAPPAIARGTEPIEVGWHPVCGHVRHISIHHRLEMPLNPTLIYGVLPNNEARSRMEECDACRPPEQTEMGLL